MRRGRSAQRPTGLAVLVLCLIAPAVSGATGAPTAAQKTTRFDPIEHLDGWEEAYYSEWSDLYPLARFEERRGESLDARGLAELRAEWKEAVARVRERLDALAEDPVGLARFRLERVVQDQRHLATLRLAHHDEEPLLLVVQKPRGSDVGHTEREAALWRGRLDPVLSRFAALEELADLPPRADAAQLAVVVLAGAEDFAAYRRAALPHATPDLLPRYDADLRAAVVYDGAPDRTAEEAFAGELIQSRYAGGDVAPLGHWLLHGLAAFLARGEGEPDPERLRAWLAAVAEAGDARWAHVRSIAEVPELDTEDQLLAFLRGRVLQRGVPAPDYAAAVASFRQQSALLFRFLATGEEGAYRDALLRATRDQLAGRGGRRSLSEAFGAVRPATIDWQFRRWAIEEHARAWPEAELAPELLLEHRDPEAPSTWLPAQAQAQAERGASAELSAQEAFALDDVPPRTRLALALCRAREGAVEEALADLGALGPLPGERDLAELVERERERLAAWARLRDAYLARLRDSGEKLRLERPDGRILAEVKAVEAGQVILAENRTGVERLPLAEIPPADLADRLGRSTDGLAPAWVLAYGYALGGDPDWRKLLRGEAGQERAEEALREDVEGELPELLSLGEAARRLLDLVRGPRPTTAGEAERRLSALRAVRERDFGHGWVQEQRPVLRKLAREACEAIFAERGAAAALRGKVQATADGGLRVTYEFDDADELLDFRSGGPLADVHQHYPKLSRDEQVSFRAEGGDLLAQGRAQLVHVARFSPPYEVRWDFTFGRAADAAGDTWILNGGLCGDGTRNFVWAINRQDLEAWEARNRRLAEPAERALMDGQKSYEMSLALSADGRADSACWGDPQQTLATRGLDHARGFLWLHSDNAVRVHRFAVQGRLDERALRELREAWIESRLSDL